MSLLFALLALGLLGAGCCALVERTWQSEEPIDEDDPPTNTETDT